MKAVETARKLWAQGNCDRMETVGIAVKLWTLQEKKERRKGSAGKVGCEEKLCTEEKLWGLQETVKVACRETVGAAGNCESCMQENCGHCREKVSSSSF